MDAFDRLADIFNGMMKRGKNIGRTSMDKWKKTNGDGLSKRRLFRRIN
jgi:hypothetical protein